MIDRSPSDILLAEIALSLYDAAGSKLVPHLVETFGSAADVFGASVEELVRRSEIKPGLAVRIAGRETFPRAEAQLEYCRRNGMVPVGISSPWYPPLLRECCDMPLVLYVMGDPAVLTEDMFAVVGTRKISPYGVWACENLVGGLSAYGPLPVVVSGLAYGVDAAAHRAALKAGLRTVAVLGNKPPRIYPSDNYGLARAILDAGGCVVSELNMGSPEGKMNFVARNRIIAGMSRATLVVESPMKGGSMITADLAVDYDRTVMAVPGRMNDKNSAGPNFLIRRLKAVAVTCAADIAGELGLAARHDSPDVSRRGGPGIVNKDLSARRAVSRPPAEPYGEPPITPIWAESPAVPSREDMPILPEPLPEPPMMPIWAESPVEPVGDGADLPVVGAGAVSTVKAGMRAREALAVIRQMYAGEPLPGEVSIGEGNTVSGHDMPPYDGAAFRDTAGESEWEGIVSDPADGNGIRKNHGKSVGGAAGNWHPNGTGFSEVTGSGITDGINPGGIPGIGFADGQGFDGGIGSRSTDGTPPGRVTGIVGTDGLSSGGFSGNGFADGQGFGGATGSWCTDGRDADGVSTGVCADDTGPGRVTKSECTDGLSSEGVSGSVCVGGMSSDGGTGRELRSQVLGIVGEGSAVTVDHLALRTGRPAQSLTAVLFELELEGLVRKAPGGTYMVL